MSFAGLSELLASRINISPAKEGISPHKITVILFIRDYCSIRKKYRFGVDNTGTANDVLEPYVRRCFALLSLQLIQGEDMELSEFQELLKANQSSLLDVHLEKFEKSLTALYANGVDGLTNLIQGLGPCMLEPNQLKTLITKTSVVGIFFRRMTVLFEKLSFSQLVATSTAFRAYANKYYGTIHLNTNEEVLIPATEEGRTASTSAMPSVSTEPVASTSRDVVDVSLPVQRYATRRQAEFFFAEQAILIQANDPDTLPPPDLQKKISELTITNPEYPETHFLSYLNCLRIQEFPGAIDSLYHCFDRSAAASDTKFTSADERCRGSRYAALNLSILFTKFGHKKEALVALKEAIRMAHELNDNVCLQYALAWMCKLTKENQEVLLERLISKSTDLNLHHLASLGIQSFAHHAGRTGGKPALVFDLLMKSDSLNNQFSMIDLACNSFALKAALWSMYGKSHMVYITSQLLLYLRIVDHESDATVHSGEGTCQAICNVAFMLLEKGEYDEAHTVLQHARDQYPFEPLSHIWMISEQILIFTHALISEEWGKAEQAAILLAHLDKRESQLRRTEVYLAQCEYTKANDCVQQLLQSGLLEDDTINPTIRARALLLEAEILSCSSAAVTSSTVGIQLFLSALAFSQRHYLDYMAALAGLHVANIQFQMGLPTQGLKLLDQFLLTVLTNGGLFDQARALLLLVKLNVSATVGSPPNTRRAVLLNAVATLDTIKHKFMKVASFARSKDVLYMQALLYNELEDYQERNACSRQYRIYDDQYPTKNPTTLLRQL